PCEGVHHAEPGAPRLEAFAAGRQLVAVVALGRLDRSGGVEPATGILGLAVDPRELDLGRGEPLARLLELLSELDLRRAEPTEPLAEVLRPERAGVDADTERRVETRASAPGELERVREARGGGS